MLIATLCMAGCEAFVGDGATPEQPDTTNKPPDTIDPGPKDLEPAGVVDPGPSTPTQMQPMSGNSGGQMPAPLGQQPACAQATQDAEATLTNYCSGCHGDSSSGQGGFKTVLEVPALIASGKVVANQPDMSLIYIRMSNMSMPPTMVMKRPGPPDIAAVRDWITCGAPAWGSVGMMPNAFVSIDQRMRSVLDDLRAIPNPVDRETKRYIDLSTLSNAGYSAQQLQVYREAVSFLLNSVSRGSTVVPPQAIDSAKLIYRIDLDDYEWDAALWNQIEQDYPYAVIYDQDSFLFPYDEVSAQQIRDETDTQIPIIQADWFLSHASRPPLYHTLLDLPANLAGLEQQLDVNIQGDIDALQVQRAGFANAGPSQNNRVIERHELGGNRGALWLSYDFSDNLDNRNIFANPLDFQENGGELIFNLDNGLQGYFVIDAAGNRLDKAPNNVVQDPASRDGAVENGLSCMNCHQVDGQLPKYDEVRAFQLMAGTNAEEIETVAAIYVEKAVLQASFDADQNRYRTARNALGIQNMTTTTMHSLDDTHLGIISLNVVASVIGISADELKRSIDATPGALPPEIVTLRTQAGGIQRDSFEAVVGELVDALGLGTQLLVTSSSSNNSTSGSDPNSGANNAPDAGVPANAAPDAGAGG